MSLTVHQQITIHQLRVDSVTNSSVLQVGAAGSIRSLSQLSNTGGFTEPAPQLGGDNPLSFVPLPNPV
ncbi:putative spore germination protein GerPB [Paenibacillus plantiphilus]|uniref:Spore germination protein GerPB n=1 Tax=Paenibacillus plantiphilus TaxID=2905650 RepID=A0ABM9CAP4_9BACL|nr:spore germination protein GerPB [Paenibacillus plantiphilus]CAH1206968.1 putative spore germination protein GerPB [Paenibacillus plantiphilus]